MMFVKRLFNRGDKKSAAQPSAGPATQQTQKYQDATRENMEAELAGARERRDAAEASPETEASSPRGQSTEKTS